MTIHLRMARTYQSEARSRYGNPAQAAFVSTLVSWARARLHRHIRTAKTGQLELFS